MTRSPVRRFGLAVLCGAAGAVINSLPVGAVAPLLLGRIATLPVAILFGPWFGGLSAAVGAVGVRGSLSVLSIAILVIEALIIGAVARRGKSPLVPGPLLWGAAAILLRIARLQEAVTALREHIDEYVGNHLHAVEALTAAVSGPTLTTTDRQRLLDRYHDIYPGFITIFIADRGGVVHEIYPRRESPPVADREYFVDAVRLRRPVVSDVILGRLSLVPIVTIAVPLIDSGGGVTGVVGGSLDLSKFERFVED